MKTPFLLLALLGAVAAGPAARAQVARAETQAVARQLNQLMRNPKKPKQDVTLTLNGCHGEQLIRDRGADVHTDRPLGLSFNSGNSGWAVKVDNGVFEMKMTFDWADVTALTYEPVTGDDKQKHFEIKVAKRKSGSNASFELPLYTTDEAVVKEVVRRLEKIRQGCRK
jgi:opacity protein-like surface antigen